MTEDWQAGGFGIYLHWPFCESKCPYCDFNSHFAQEIDQSHWNRAYLSEIERYQRLLPDRVLSSVFLGGGTPSLMEPESVAAVIAAIKSSWPTVNDLEITLEANPSSVEAGRFAAYAEAGVTRISMGVQALNDGDLRRLGRLHSVSDARSAFDTARKYFDRVSFDLIYARQDQSVSEWRAELNEALAMAVDHLSLYQLTIEAGTAFGDRYARGKLTGLPDEDRAVAMFNVTQDVCASAGMPAYEVSNHAQSGSESRHNLIYWRYGDYIGIGPGAHGRITTDGVRKATFAWSSPDRWLRGVDEGQPDKSISPLSNHDQLCEFVLMGLRLSDGICLDRYARLAGDGPPEEAISDLSSMALVEVEDGRLRATRKGRNLLNSVIEALLP